MNEHFADAINYFIHLSENELLIAFILFILLQSMMTIFHEAGHYYAAKLCGINSQEFTLGIGPEIVKFKTGESRCLLSIRTIPFGGRVLYEDHYWDASDIQRAFMSIGGWLADSTLAILAIVVLLALDGRHPISVAICAFLVLRSMTSLLPFTSDGRKAFHYLCLALSDRAATKF